MSITVEVALLSGRTATVEADLDESVDTLQIRAQTALGVGRGRLLDASGRALHSGSKITDAVQSGDALSLQVSRV